jgi:hypothetical protein
LDLENDIFSKKSFSKWLERGIYENRVVEKVVSF